MSEALQPTPGQAAPSQPAILPGAPELAPEVPAHGGVPANMDGQSAPQDGAPQQPTAPAPSDGEEPKWKGRFSDLSKQAREEREARIAAEARARAIEEMALRNLAPPAPAPAATVEAPDPEPLPENFRGGAFDPEYTKAWARWDNRQQLKQLRGELAKEQAAQTALATEQAEFAKGKALFDEAVSICGEFAAQTPNAADTLMRLAKPPQAGGVGLPNHLVDLITSDESPHLIAEYLHHNPQEVAQFQRDIRAGFAGQARVAARIGQISLHYRSRAAANAAPSPSPRQQTASVPQVVAIPPPVNGVGAGSFNPETADFRAFEEYARKVRSQ